KKLKDLIRMFKIKGILLHKETKEFIPISELNTNKLFEEKGLLKSLEMLKSDEVMEERFRIMKENVNNNFKVIDNELKKLIQILDNRG
ncbi:hypothetical protein P9131_16310, partial [Bacillus thuringiensis]|nr:hypothetical protein [Bacillus thuringiensis]